MRWVFLVLLVLLVGCVSSGSDASGVFSVSFDGVTFDCRCNFGGEQGVLTDADFNDGFCEKLDGDQGRAEGVASSSNGFLISSLSTGDAIARQGVNCVSDMGFDNVESVIVSVSSEARAVGSSSNDDTASLNVLGFGVSASSGGVNSVQLTQVTLRKLIDGRWEASQAGQVQEVSEAEVRVSTNSYVDNGFGKADLEVNKVVVNCVEGFEFMDGGCVSEDSGEDSGEGSGEGSGDEGSDDGDLISPMAILVILIVVAVGFVLYGVWIFIKK